eukprot:Gb_21547 [translate_table: standard]
MPTRHRKCTYEGIVEIKRILESLYGLEVEKVHTLNMEGKKKRRGGIVYAKPDYKKAYVTLKHPISLPENLFPINVLEEEKESTSRQKDASALENPRKVTHWLEDSKRNGFKPEPLESQKDKSEARRSRAPWHSQFAWR